jgi:protein-disulfide isomerase
LRETLHDFGDSISVYHIAYPLPYHPQAMKVARAAECAASSGRFAQWIDVIYSQQDSLPSETWGRLARRAGIEDSAQIARCARDTLPEARIAEQRDFGDRIGVAGTPTILINGWKLPTTPTAAQLKAEVRSFLRGEQPFGKAGAR